MTAPVVTDVAERIYRLLPLVYRSPDRSYDYALLRLVRTFGDILDDQATLVARLDRRLAGDRSHPSDLTSPDHANPEWLGWLGQAVGVRDDAGLPLHARRAALAGAAQGWKAGSPTALVAAASSALTGTRYARVYPRSISAIGNGGRWDLMIVTRVSETPDVNAVLDAVRAADVAPAGVVLHHKAYSATYTQVQGGTTPDTYAGRLATFPTYQDASDYLPPGS